MASENFHYIQHQKADRWLQYEGSGGEQPSVTIQEEAALIVFAHTDQSFANTCSWTSQACEPPLKEGFASFQGSETLVLVKKTFPLGFLSSFSQSALTSFVTDVARPSALNFKTKQTKATNARRALLLGISVPFVVLFLCANGSVLLCEDIFNGKVENDL